MEIIEKWKRIKETKNYYVSNYGNVKTSNYNHTNKEKILKPIKYNNGYLYVNINGKIRAIHRLVAETFILNPYSKPQVNHKDGNKLNNKLDNLEWVTARENTIHALKNGLINTRTEKTLKAKRIQVRKLIEKNKIRIKQYSKDGIYINTYNSIIEASKYTNSNSTHISLCAKGKQKTCGGYIWKYETN